MQYDIAIIGGGPGGYVAALYAAKHKKKVALIEKDELGGVCLNKGCIPTKALINSANTLAQLKQINKTGLIAKDIGFNWQKIQQNKLSVVKTLKSGVANLLKINQVDIYKGIGCLVDSNTINITGNTDEKTITADNTILATGSLPTDIPIPGNDLGGVITSSEALSLSEPPKSLLIIGGGVVGVELGYIYSAFGTEVTIVEMLPNILPQQDEELAKELKKMLEIRGIRIHTNAKVKQIQKTNEGLKTTYEDQDGIQTITTQKVLVSVGRSPVKDAYCNLNLKQEHGRLFVNEYLQTSIPNIYAIGDITGQYMLAHVASHQGITAVKNILGEATKMEYNAVPSCIFTQPEMASVGLTEKQAKEKYGDNINIGRFPFMASGKALTMGEKSGFVKIISEGRYNQIIGVHIVGPNATELIAEAVLAIKLECTVEEMADTIHAHPTLSETTMEASFDLLGMPIHKG